MTYTEQPLKQNYTDAQAKADLQLVFQKFDALWPSVQYTNYPQPSYVINCLMYVGGTVEAVTKAISTLTSYFGNNGTPTENASARYMTWGNKHGWVEEILRNVFAWGVPLPPKEGVVGPQLVATFSEAAIQARINIRPFPMRYDGAPCFSDEPWFADASEHLAKVLSNIAWDVVPYATKRALSLSLWLPGQTYCPAGLSNPTLIEGWTAAQVFRYYDVATLPGVPATD